MEAGVKLSSVYGATEVGPFNSAIATSESAKYWEWTRVGPNSKIRWFPLGDGTYEMQVLVSRGCK